MRYGPSIFMFAAATLACGGNAVPATAQVADQNDAMADSAHSLVPAGLGQLSQDAITLRMSSNGLEIRFTPLDQRVIRLLANDAYRSLDLMVERNQDTIDSLARSRGISDPGVVLVSFFALTPNVSFDPNLLAVISRNRVIRPQAFISMSASFGARRLEVRNQATAMFIYERPIPVTEPFTISYRDASSDDWERRLVRFDRERARIQAKSPPSRPDTGG